MSSRAELELRAAKANVAYTTIPNDSLLEQQVIKAEKASIATATATTLAAPVASAQAQSGGAA